MNSGERTETEPRMSSEASPQTNEHVGSASLEQCLLPRLRRGVENLTHSVGISGVKFSREALASDPRACNDQGLARNQYHWPALRAGVDVLTEQGLTQNQAFEAVKTSSSANG